MKIEIKFVRNEAAPSPRKKAIRRVIALLALLALIFVIPASAKFVGEGDVVWSTKLDSVALDPQYPITFDGATGEIGLVPGMWVPNYTASVPLTFVSGTPVATGVSGFINTTYAPVTAPGWVRIEARGTGNSAGIDVNVDGVRAAGRWDGSGTTTSRGGFSATVLVRKGAVVSVTVTGDGTGGGTNGQVIHSAVFFPAMFQAFD